MQSLHHKQHILTETIFSYMFCFGLPGTCLYLSPQTHLSGTGGVGVRKVYFSDLSKDMFLKSKMNHAVKYFVYWEILLRVPIYITKY